MLTTTEGPKQAINKIMAETHVPGVSVVIVSKGKVLWQEQFGLAAQGRASKELLHFGFGHGPRVCPGKHLGQLEVALVVGAFVKLFRFQAVHTGYEAKAGVSTKPRDGTFGELEMRKQNFTEPKAATDRTCPFGIAQSRIPRRHSVLMEFDFAENFNQSMSEKPASPRNKKAAGKAPKYFSCGLLAQFISTIRHRNSWVS